MYTINVNGTTSHTRCKQHEARQIVAGMSNEQKQRTLDNIHIHQGVNNLIGQQYDTEMLHYIEKLLTGGKQ